MGNENKITGIPFTIQLQDEDGKKAAAPKMIQLFRAGEFTHGFFGHFSLTTEIFAQMKKNFDAGVAGIDVAVEFGHSHGGPAAGWIRNVILRDKGRSVWAEVQWTTEGQEKVEDKQFRYTSPDFDRAFVDQDTGEVHGHVLEAVALTNRPFLRNMKPTVQLTEFKEGDSMETSEELKKKIEEANAKLAESKKENEALTSTNVQLTQEVKKLKPETKTDPPEQNVELEAANKKNAELQAKIDEGEKNTKFNVLLQAGTVVEAQRPAYMEDDIAQFAETGVKTQENPKGTGKTKLTDAGGGGKSATPIQDSVIKLAAEKRKEDTNLSYDDSVDIVLSEDSKLYQAYEDEVEAQAG